MKQTNPPTSDKIAVRQIMKDALSGMSEKHKEKETSDICLKIRGILSDFSPGTLVVYVPLPDEVDISPVVDWYRTVGKDIITIEQNTPPEGIGSLPENSTLLVPGRAFTMDGKRVGRGGGFYDRLLAKYPKAYAIGVCFSNQLFRELPQDIWDKRMNAVVFGGNTLE